MKRIIILLITIFMLISSVSAISIISSSNIDFTSNNPDYPSGAFVVTGVENGGNDVITWTMDNFDENIDDGFTVSKSGTISSRFTSLGFSYPIVYKATGYDIIQKGETKYFLTSSGASDWCFNELGGDKYVNTGYGFIWACLDIFPSSYTFDLNVGTNKYKIDYILNIDGEPDDVITLTDTTSVGSKLIGQNNFFHVVRQTDGRPPKSDPDVNDKISLLYDLSTGAWRTVVPDFPSTSLSFDSVSSFYDDCKSGIFGAYSWDECISEWYINKNNIIINNNKPFSNINMNEISVSNNGQASGSLKYDDGNIYRNPIVTITIDADKLGVQRTFSEGKITNIDYTADMILNSVYPFSISVRNIGDVEMDATLDFNCPSFEIDGIKQRVTLAKGVELTQNGLITYTGLISGTTTKQCEISLRNTNALEVDDTRIISIEVKEMNECDEQGKTQCFGNIVRKCENQNGVLKYVTIQECLTTCQQVDDYRAICDDDTKAVCGDGICAFIEQDGQEQYCPTDCDPVIPLCGDGICDGRERQGQQFECVVGIQENGDCPPEVVPPRDYTMLIFVITSISLIVGALYFRMKKEGYFG